MHIRHGCHKKNYLQYSYQHTRPKPIVTPPNFPNWKNISLQLGKNIFLTGEKYFRNWAF